MRAEFSIMSILLFSLQMRKLEHGEREKIFSNI